MAKKKKPKATKPTEPVFTVCPRCGNRFKTEGKEQFKGCCSASCKDFMDRNAEPQDDAIPASELED